MMRKRTGGLVVGAIARARWLLKILLPQQLAQGQRSVGGGVMYMLRLGGWGALHAVNECNLVAGGGGKGGGQGGYYSARSRAPSSCRKLAGKVGSERCC